MRKILILSIFIFIFCFLPKIAEAGIITKPVFNTGLIGYWNFQEGAGSNVYDKSGYDNDGVWTGTAEYWADGKIGGGGNFDGGTTYVDCSDPAEFEFGSNDFTISAWAYRNTGWETWDGIVAGKWNTGSSPGTNEFNFIHGGSSDTYPRLAIESGTETYVATSSETTYDDTWYHIVGMRTGDYLKIFVNGVEKGDVYIGNVSVNNISGRTLQFGKIDGGSYGLNGYMDEVRIYNRALSDDEIQRLYKLSQPKILAPTNTGLVGYWSFEEGMGTNVGDHSGNGNNGTWNGAGSHWTTGRFGNGGDFNGSGDNDYVNLSSDINLSGDFTYSWWMKANSLAQSSPIFEKDANDLWIEFRGGNYLQIKESGESSEAWYPGWTAQTEKWEHVVITRESNVDTAYLNGVAGGVTHAGTAAMGIDRIGMRNTEYFNGEIDEVRIYDRDLSANEIEALYKSGRAKINASQNNQLTDGLVGFWSFNGPDMDGNEAYDRSGQGNTGTLTGTTRTIGKVGQALDFNGSTDYVNVPENNNDFDITNNITISTWVKLDDLDRVESVVCKEYLSDVDCVYQIRTYQSGNRFDFVFFNGTSYKHTIPDVSIIYSTNRWYHVAGTYDGNTRRLYMDGLLVKETIEAAGSILTTNDPLRIGTETAAPWYLKGSIDEVRIYNRALSAQEVQRLYNLGR